MEAWSGMDNSDEAVQMVPAKKSNRVESFKYDTLPADFRDALAVFDEDGSGDLNAAEIRKAAKTYKDFSNNNGVYALDSFPNDLQSTPSPPLLQSPSHLCLNLQETCKAGFGPDSNVASILYPQMSSRCLMWMAMALSVLMSLDGCVPILVAEASRWTIRLASADFGDMTSHDMCIGPSVGSTPQACVLYRDSRRKFKKAVRGAMVLAFIVLFLLAANCGLVFAVVYLTKVLP